MEEMVGKVEDWFVLAINAGEVQATVAAVVLVRLLGLLVLPEWVSDDGAAVAAVERWADVGGWLCGAAVDGGGSGGEEDEDDGEKRWDQMSFSTLLHSTVMSTSYSSGRESGVGEREVNTTLHARHRFRCRLLQLVISAVADQIVTCTVPVIWHVAELLFFSVISYHSHGILLQKKI
ncbi:hypothetical protein QYF36_003480 [Acer negundo]|nr:hypothetical protein QYF36_003480 [Acer negundo]